MFLWQVLEQCCDPSIHRIVLDLCAAPGGKSTLLSDFFNKGLVISNEVIKSRASILQENVTKWGDAGVAVTNNDARDFRKLQGYFDVIVTDVPCSGSGLFRRDPSAIEEWSPANVELCCQRQQRILADIVPCLKENGVLIYSTCSYSREEDEDILDWLVKEFGLETLSLNLPAGWNIIESVSPQYGAKAYRFFPDRLKGEGFFIAALRQPNGDHTAKLKETALQMPTTKEKAELAEIIPVDSELLFFRQGEEFRLFPSAYLTQLKQVAAQLYIRQAGVGAGSFKGKSFVPGHGLATSGIRHQLSQLELERDQALTYLRKQEIDPAAPEGWCQVNYLGLGLGWIKKLPNRTNNYYPAEWRILKS